MADNEKTEEEKEDQPAAKAAPKKKLPMGVIGALVAGAAVSGAVFFFKPQPKATAAKAEVAAKKEEAKHEDSKHKEGAPGEGGEGSIVALQPFIVNLSDEDQVSYLKCTLAVELSDKDLAGALEKKSVPIRNSVILYLASLAVADTRGTKNKEKILSNVTDRVNSVLGQGSVLRIYISEFVVQ